MNPFTGTLSRLGFAVWTFLFYLAAYTLALARNKAWINIGQGTGTLGEIIAYMLIVLLVLLGALLLIRRLQDAKLPSWLAILALLPFIGFIFWIVLLFIPPKH